MDLLLKVYPIVLVLVGHMVLVLVAFDHRPICAFLFIKQKLLFYILNLLLNKL